MVLLVTGGAGFIGSNFVRFWLERHPDDTVVNLDSLTYAGCPESLADVEERFGDRYRFVRGDIGNLELTEHLLTALKIDAIVNFAAESHNSRAILDPGAFVRANVLGTQQLLEAARRAGNVRFHHVSTCEVFGDLPLDSPESFSEESPYAPRTPYNASKAGADFEVQAYRLTFDLPTTLSYCANNYGAYQFPEKLIPLFITKALDDQPLTLYKSSQNQREWLHVLDHCTAIEAILERGVIGESYCIGSGEELSVEEVTAAILRETGKPESLKTYVPDRPSHDRRYLLNSEKIRRELGWAPTRSFDEGIGETVAWYRANEAWWRPLQARLAIQEGQWQAQTGG